AEQAHLPERGLAHVAHTPAGNAARQREVDERPVYGRQDEGTGRRDVLLPGDLQTPVALVQGQQEPPGDPIQDHGSRPTTSATTSSTVRAVVSMTTASSAGRNGETLRFE